MLADFSFFIIVFIDSLIVYLVYRALRRYSLVASPSFINHLPWLHGIVKCQSDANFTISEEVVGHPGTFCLPWNSDILLSHLFAVWCTEMHMHDTTSRGRSVS